MSDFTHLHVHSHYSLLNALPKIPDLVKYAKKCDMKALALTDNGNLYGAIEFYKACKKNDIKPIIGVDAFVAVRGRADKQSGVDNRRFKLILLAKNDIGYKNLIKLVTEANLEGFYYRPRIDMELIKKYHEGLIAILPAMQSEVSISIRNGDEESALAALLKYKEIFGVDLYSEITIHPEMENHLEVIEKVIKFSDENSVKIVAGHEISYLQPTEKKARDTLMSIQTNADFGERIFETEDSDYSFPKPTDINKKFKGLERAIHATSEIVDKCNLELELGKWVFPNIIVESGRSYNDELRHVVYEGLKRRRVEATDEVKTRIEYELGIIYTKGYAPYFLVVGDLLKFAHEKGILTTIRGSVAGSMVTYLAGITNVNPLEYKLPFERFLNPERPSAPDIDMDYADNRRDEMIEYARQKYGHDKVAQIGTFGTMMARGAVRDVARALGFQYSVGDTIAKLVPMGSQGFPMTLKRALEIVPELKTLYRTDANTKTVIEMAMKIEGCARHISVHAAGVVISPTPLTDFVPLQFDTKGENKIITQYDMHAVEDAGLLKFDFLGIRNLAILADSVRLTKEIHNISVDIENVPISDEKTFALLAKGETGGLFQLNGTGMTNYLKQLKPSSIFDINAMVALYRPGPMESIPQYIERKHNPRLVTYLDPRMKDILSQSYGVITYQDDVLLIAINLAGYSWLEADMLRKAMGKKIPAVMEAEKGKLLAGLMKNGMTKEKADQLWLLIEPFAAYGFNKSHAASYGRVAYQTAYMKANFPAVYMASVLTAESGDVEKVGEIIAECKRMEIEVLPPDINESLDTFTPIIRPGNKSAIRFGLTSIKNFGQGIAQAIIAERQKGKFLTLADFLERVRDRNLNKKSLESLIKCGALDQFGTRGEMLANLESLLEYNKQSRGASENQSSLFGLMTDTSSLPTLRLEKMPDIDKESKLSMEKELLGLYVSGHPLDRIRSKIEKHDITIQKVVSEFKEGTSVVIPGIIEEIKDLLTKKGEKMMFLKIADYSASMEVVVFPRVCEEYKRVLIENGVVAVKGKVSFRNGSFSLLADEFMAI